MKKNRTMRVAALLLALTLITSCFVGGTFAKYITTTTADQTGYVAFWGFNQASVTEIDNLFAHGDSAVKTGVVAPGSYKSVMLKIAPAAGAAPDVAYRLQVSAEGSSYQNLPQNLKWYYGTEAMTSADQATLSWGQMMQNIEALSGDFAADTLPTNSEIYIGWGWVFGDPDNNTQDTEDGINYGGGDAINVKVTVTAAQLDEYPAP